MNIKKLSNIVFIISTINIIVFICAIFIESISTYNSLIIAFFTIIGHFYLITPLAKMKEELIETASKDLKESIEGLIDLNKLLLGVNGIIFGSFILLMGFLSQHA